MRCPSCNSENPGAIKFCGNCGRPLKNQCAKCGAENPPQFRFCGQCGTALSNAPTAALAEPPLSASADREAERRHLTVLFCDLVGSTEIAARLDPEEWRETVAGYHRAAAEAITRFDGHVAKYLGDGVMAYFGWPEAHDNDAERAVRAGLAILDAITKLNEQPANAKLAARIGVDSGLVVIGKGAGQDADVFGDAPNIAARVEAAAEPGTVAITGATHRLASGLFVVEDRGAHPLKGIDQPVQLYRVLRPSGMRRRFGATAAGMTSFFGREDELRILMSRWERVREGDGQVVTIVGEAGIGKSRLLQRFQEEIAADPNTWLECATAPFFRNTPFYAIVDMLRQSFHWNASQSMDQRLAALEASLRLAGVDPNEAVPLIAPLLELAVGAKYPPLPLAPDQQRKRLLATLVAWTFGSAKAQPLVIATEDLHWADPSTLELTQLLVEQGATARLMLLYTARPEFHAQWPRRAHHTQINLNQLAPGNVRAMVADFAAKIALSDETIATVVKRTGGVPLFVEELTRAVLESGDAKLSGREIPATLHDSLMARLDRLGPAKEVAQIGSVIGGEFSYELLRAVHPIAEDELQGALRRLADAELLYVHGIAPDATYQFKHALIRDAAYEALLKSRRKELHRSVAQTIDEQFPGLKETHPEILARHWSEAGETEQAIVAWSRAAKNAEAHNAFKEGLDSYQKAVDLFGQMPESPDRDSRELELRQSIVRMLFMTSGYSGPETIEAAERAAALAEKSGNLRQLINLLITRGISCVVGGDLVTGRALADQASGLAVREGSPSCLGRAHLLQLMANFYRGDLAAAESHFIFGLKYFDHPSFIRVPGVAVAAFNYGSWSAWVLGRTDAARARTARMLAVANGINPYDAVFSERFAAELHIYMREYEQARTLAARALESADKHQFAGVGASVRLVLGQARVELGCRIEGISLIREGIAGSLESGERAGVSHFSALLGIALHREGAIVDALETVEQALRANPHELVYRPEILRLRGRLRLKQGDLQLADADFRESIAMARSMNAKAWELRTTMSLARLLSKRGRRDEARAMLAEIYGWFSEGFDTADLKDAKALLEELAA